MSDLNYFDHSATTPTDLRVVAAMAPYWTLTFGNASSLHQAGKAALRNKTSRGAHYRADALEQEAPALAEPAGD